MSSFILVRLFAFLFGFRKKIFTYGGSGVWLIEIGFGWCILAWFVSIYMDLDVLKVVCDGLGCLELLPEEGEVLSKMDVVNKQTLIRERIGRLLFDDNALREFMSLFAEDFQIRSVLLRMMSSDFL